MNRQCGIVLCSMMALLLPFALWSQDANALIRDARELEARFREQEALNKYLEVLILQPDHIVALCKASELYNTTGKRHSDKDQQKACYRASLDYARKALAVNGNNAEANFVMSIAMGRLAMMASGEEKIKAVKDIRRYAERAIQLDPNGYKAYHVLGKWHYEVSNLSSLERWLVKVTYGALPKASYADAVKCYEKSRSLNPALLINYLEEAKARFKNNDPEKAKELLRTINRLPDASADDALIRKEAWELLNKWSS